MYITYICDINIYEFNVGAGLCATFDSHSVLLRLISTLQATYFCAFLLLQASHQQGTKYTPAIQHVM